MKKLSKKSLSLIILSIVLIFCLSANVLATDLIDVTSNTTGKTNTATQTNTADKQNITQINSPTFTNVSQTVYAKKNTNIKESYSTSSTTTGTLLKDQSIKRTGISENGWSRVETTDGKTAYIQTNDLTLTAPTTTPINDNNSSVYNNVTKNTTNTTNTLPQTGIGDNTGMYIITGICVVCAIYAYKKIRDYNI